MGRTMLIVDDHEGFRSHARALFAAAGYDVVGEAGDGLSAVRSAEELMPDVVLLDIQLPDINGFDVAERILEAADPPAVVLTSSREASDFGRRIGRSGARAFISKGELTADTLSAALEAGR